MMICSANSAAKIGTGAVYRLFLEPIVQDINYFTRAVPNAGDVSMTGLSGGGWTATMAPAVDSRIKLSIPVAGSAPFYCRLNDPAARGRGRFGAIPARRSTTRTSNPTAAAAGCAPTWKCMPWAAMARAGARSW